MLFDSTGEFHEWSNNLPKEWLPGDVASTELVACIDDPVEVQFGLLCRYTGGYLLPTSWVCSLTISAK